MSRGDLTEVEWRILRVLLPVEREPGKRGRGRPPEDNRNIINGVLWRLRTGAPWRDVPEKYGNWNSIYRRFRRWSACGVWESVATALAEAMAESGHYNIDSTTVRAHVRIGLAHREGVLSANGSEALRKPKLFQQLHRQPFELVSADGEGAALRSQSVERLFESRKRPRPVGDVRRVNLEVLAKEAVDLLRRKVLSLGRERALQQRLDAGANHSARFVECDRCNVMMCRRSR